MHAPRPLLAPLRSSRRPEIAHYGRRRAFNAPTLSRQKRLLAKDGTAKKSPPPGTPDAGAATPRREMALDTLVDFVDQRRRLNAWRWRPAGQEDEGGGTSCVALKRSPEEDEDWSCLGCRTAGKGPPDTPGELPTRRRRGPRGSRTWWRAGGAVGRAAARHDGADACRRRRVGQRLRQGARPGPL